MAPRPPYSENYRDAIKITGLISVLAHAALLCALAWLFPFVSAPQTDTGVTIDLASLGAPAERADNNARMEPPLSQAPAARQTAAYPPDASSLAEKTAIPPDAALPVKKSPARSERGARAALAQKLKAPEKNPPESPRKSQRPSPVNASAVNAGSALLEAGASQSKTAIGGSQTVSAPMAEPSNPKPAYPELARKRGQEGTARIRCEVDAAGNVIAASILESSGHKLLDEAALKAVRKWRFRPALSNGRPAPGSVIAPVEFRLR